MSERFGAFTFGIGLRVGEGALHFPVTRGRLGPLPLPRPLLPESRATESAEDGRFRFDVELRAPLGLGPIVRYRGWLAPASDLDNRDSGLVNELLPIPPQGRAKRRGMQHF